MLVLEGLVGLHRSIQLQLLQPYWLGHRLGLLYIMEYYSAIKKNERMPFAATRMDLEIIIQSEVSQRQISYDITYIWSLKKKDTNELIYTRNT